MTEIVMTEPMPVTADSGEHGWPISTAPIKPGVEFGPCLAWAEVEWMYDAQWQIAYWDGYAWYHQAAGGKISPLAWAPLPPPWK